MVKFTIDPVIQRERALRDLSSFLGTNDMVDTCKNEGKIFGIGFGKTGTTSLARSLQLLGCNVLHDVSGPVWDRPLKNDLSMLKRIAFDAYINPAPKSFYMYDSAFPNSKFILTTRSPDTWFKSILSWRAAIDKIVNGIPARKHWSESSGLQSLLGNASDLQLHAYLEYIENFGSIGTNKESFVYKFNRHIEEVKQYFAERPNDLLVLPVESPDKSTLLSAFLSKDWPKNIDYPHENRQTARGLGSGPRHPQTL